ncbi:MAG: hypothetical protein LC733_06530, partial [Actinobacteria bacterium]|nr:hypothetical protein [Actinomycetota bacterium]
SAAMLVPDAANAAQAVTARTQALQNVARCTEDGEPFPPSQMEEFPLSLGDAATGLRFTCESRGEQLVVVFYVWRVGDVVQELGTPLFDLSERDVLAMAQRMEAAAVDRRG